MPDRPGLPEPRAQNDGEAVREFERDLPPVGARADGSDAPIAIQLLLPTLSHELSEALTAIANYLEVSRTFMRRGNPTGHDETQSAIEKAQLQTMRAAQVARRIRELIRPGGSTGSSS